MAVKPVLTPVDPSLTQDCPKPVQLPERDLTQKEVEGAWSKDRVNLLNCGDTKKAVVDFYSLRDLSLTGGK